MRRCIDVRPLLLSKFTVKMGLMWVFVMAFKLADAVFRYATNMLSDTISILRAFCSLIYDVEKVSKKSEPVKKVK